MNVILYAAPALCCAFVVIWKILNWGWFRPKELERLLRQQGFQGNPYRFLIGDFKEMFAMTNEARSKPIGFSDDVLARVAPFISDSVNKHGKNCFIWLGPKATALISENEMVKEVFAKSYVFQKNHTPLDKLLAQGLAMYETDKWAKHRKLINPAFHLEKLKLMLPSFYWSCSEMLAKWDEIVPNEGTSELDVWPFLQAMTSEALSRTAFGSNYEEGRKIFQVQREQAELLLRSTLLFFVPGWRFLPTRANRKMKRNVKEVESAILGIIDKRMKRVEAGETNSDDLLGTLLESNFKEIQENGNAHGMSMEEVIEECKLFYIAGQETTSAMLAWTMILLGKHLEWQARAREEVLQVFGSSIPDLQDLNRLKIVTMIFHEVLRLYPAAPMLGRAIVKDTTLGDIALPAGMQLIIPTILMHYDTTIWGENAKEFDPERFSEGVSKATNGQFAYFPFAAGPRICIGQNFAMLEAKMAIAMILKRYSFEVSPSYAHAPDQGLSLQPQYGAQLIVHKL